MPIGEFSASESQEGDDGDSHSSVFRVGDAGDHLGARGGFVGAAEDFIAAAFEAEIDQFEPLFAKGGQFALRLGKEIPGVGVDADSSQEGKGGVEGVEDAVR